MISCVFLMFRLWLCALFVTGGVLHLSSLRQYVKSLWKPRWFPEQAMTTAVILISSLEIFVGVLSLVDSCSLFLRVAAPAIFMFVVTVYGVESVINVKRCGCGTVSDIVGVELHTTHGVIMRNLLFFVTLVSGVLGAPVDTEQRIYTILISPALLVVFGSMMRMLFRHMPSKRVAAS
jgi:hypothetical protein